MKRQNFLMLAAAALLASCSQDDALQSTVHNNEGLKPMTITVSLPTDGMQTRAEDDEAATRCYVQILNGDGTELEDGNSEPIPMNPDGKSFSTTVYLNGSEIYDFLFWADTEATDAAAPADLRAVEYTNGKTIAWAGKLDNAPWTAGGIEISLKHVVSRVTVITTSDFAGSEIYPFIVTVPTVYNKYNVAASAVVADSNVSGGYELNVTDGEYEANTEVCHFYVLGGNETTSQEQLTLQYKGPHENPVIPFSNVPLLANYHITLKDDIYNAGLVNGTITATTTTGWDTPETGDIPFK